MAVLSRVGIFGGTFNPVHVGHLLAAIEARQFHNLDKVLFVVAPRPAQKAENLHLSAFNRLVMTDLALEGLDWAEVSTIEMDREGTTFTIDTLEALHSAEDELFLIVGEDQFHNMSTWHRYKEIPDFATVCLVPRWLSLSSTIVRQRVQHGSPLTYLVPEPVIIYIERYGLYKDDDAS